MEDPPPQEPKPEPVSHINVRIASQGGSSTHFKIKRTTALGKMMDAYCARSAVAPTSVRFLFNGERIEPSSTAESMGVQDGDVIDAVLQQTGGATWH
jgi:hypothetical protein